MDELLAALVAQLRGEQSGDPAGALTALAEALSSCDDAQGSALVRAIEQKGVLPLLVARFSTGLERKDRLLYLVLSVLVNLGDVGGAEISLRHGVFELLLSLVDSDETDVRYYACAGIQNVSAPLSAAIKAGTAAN